MNPMLTVLCLSLTLVSQASPATLPDTAQGKRVAAYLKAFNSGDEKTFVAAHTELFVPEFSKRNPREAHAKMFQRMKGDFGTLTIKNVLKASAQQIRVVIPTKAGDDAIFTFDFEDKTPYRIAGIGVDVEKTGDAVQ
jgi:hypothetical protein